MNDDAGRSVEYRYDAAGRLYSVRGIGSSQWRYRYDASGYLEGVTDPRGIDALTASYDPDGRASDVRVLYDTTRFQYQGSSTVVRNGLQQSATFWLHDSGLTNTIQDFSGTMTELAFDSSLRPASLSFNGAAVADLRYDPNGRLLWVRSSVEGRPRLMSFSYDRAGRISTAIADNQAVAEYAYDPAGRLIRARDASGPRSYEYLSATGHRINLGGTEFDIEMNGFGLMTGFSNGHQSIGISYNTLDQVSSLGYFKYGEVSEATYTYGASGLRSGGSYTIAEEQPTPAGLSLDYDVVGNLTNLGVETPSGARSSQTYVLGTNNQLTRLMNPQRPDLVFEYDAAGRPTRRVLGENDVSYTYDPLGRIAAVYEGSRKILEWRYGPMDLDAATEADVHSPWTAINEPIASAIFGSAESIAYARTRGTPYGPVRFSASMARFVLAAQLIPSADGVMLVGLQRRNLPLSSDHHAYASPAPLGFDKPSNSLFLPPEFSSLNCYLCVGRFSGTGFNMSINGSMADPVVVTEGTEASVAVGGSIQCWQDIYNMDNWEVESTAGVVEHYFDFGDGNWYSYGTSGSVNKTAYAYYSYAGLYNVRADITCGCYYGGMFWDTASTGRNAQVCSQADINGRNGSGLLGRSATIANRYYMGQSDFENSIFRFKLIANENDVPNSGDRSTLGSQATVWDRNRSFCGESYTSDITHEWATGASVNVRVTIDPAISDYGEEEDNACGGLDCIRLNPARYTNTYAHEIGHALGFLHSNTTNDLMCNNCSSPESRDVQGWHISKLLAFYAQYY
jgi:YD repeat-containing protein